MDSTGGSAGKLAGEQIVRGEIERERERERSAEGRSGLADGGQVVPSGRWGQVELRPASGRSIIRAPASKSSFDNVAGDGET